MTLAEHDKKYHPNGYKEGDSCEYRMRKAKLDPVDADIAEGGISGIYTGSAANYSRPSLLSVGSGEGSQVYGWGLYGSNVKGVAEGYANAQSSANDGLLFEGKPFSADTNRYGPYKDAKERAMAAVLTTNGDMNAAREFLEENTHELLGGVNEKGVEALKWFDENKDKFSKYKPHLYSQTFFTNRAPGDESHLMKWYSSEGVKKLVNTIKSELPADKSEEFRKAINRAGKTDYGARQAVWNENVYQVLSDTLGSQKAASEFLRDKCDIDGIKYPVNSFGGKPITDGDTAGWNYVSFRDDNIRIDKKFIDGVETDVKDGIAMDADETNGLTLPPDLMAHDAKYHHGHYDGKSKCKYREERQAALAAMKEGESEKDIVDRLSPEDVDGEEIDKVDMLDPQDKGGKQGDDLDITKLESVLPKMKGAAASVIKGLIEKKKIQNIQPMLNTMADAISFAANNNAHNDNKFNDAMENLAALVKSGALNEMLGIGKVPNAIQKQEQKETVKSQLTDEQRTQLMKDKDNLTKDIDMIREKMQLASPRLAALLQAQLGDMQKQMKNIDVILSGKGLSVKDAEKKAQEEAKAKKEAEKAAKKAAVAATKSNQDGAAPGVKLNSAKYLLDLPLGKTSVLSGNDFANLMSKVPNSRRIFALSDFHDAGVKNIDPSGCGTVICAGDFTKHGATSHSKNIDMASAIKTGNEWLQKKFFKWCDKNKDKHIVLIAGNHDHFLGDASADNIKWPDNVNYLKDSEAMVRGMRVYGTPWCEKRKGAAKTASMTSSVAQQPFEIDDDAIKEKFDKIPEGLDILVVHQTPKFDYKDDKGNDIGPDVAFVGGVMKHCGSEALTEAIKRAKPKLVICGHLHDGDHRPYKIGDTVVVNGSYVANRGDPSWTAHEIGSVKYDTASGTEEFSFFVDGENNHQMTTNS